jgi:CBS domain-containing protein
MKIKEIMTTDLRTCPPSATAADAARLMWDGDCGFLPVVDEGKLTGVVTDRDLYIALATRNISASELRLGEVATRTVVTCAPEDDVHAALAEMKKSRVRRLPVLGFGGTILGIVSMNDILLVAGPAQDVHDDQVVETLQAICAHHHPVAHLVGV